MLIADEITLIVPISGVDRHELFLHNFNIPEIPSVYDSMDEILRLGNEKIIRIENGFIEGDENQHNIRKLYGIGLMENKSFTDFLFHQINVMKIAQEKEAIILDLHNSEYKSIGLIEHIDYTKASLLKHCHVYMPDLSRLNYIEIVTLKKKFEDEILEAQYFINSLSFEISNRIRIESYEEQQKYIQKYIKELINPRVKQMIKAIRRSKYEKVLDFGKELFKLSPLLFTPTKLPEAIGELIKTSVDLTEKFKKEEKKGEGAFLSLIARSYK